MSNQFIRRSTSTHPSPTTSNNNRDKHQRTPHPHHRTHHRKRSRTVSLSSSSSSTSSSQQQQQQQQQQQHDNTADDRCPPDNASVDLPTPPPSPVGFSQPLTTSPRSMEHNARILAAKRGGNLRGVMGELGAMKKKGIPLTHHTYNLVLDAHAMLRREGTPLTQILKLYEEMQQAGIAPTSYTYTVLIRVLCRRDVEVQKTTAMLKRQAARTGVAGRAEADMQTLEAEHNLEKALDIFRGAAARHPQLDLDIELYNQLLRVLSHYGNKVDGRFVFDHLVQSTSPNSATYAALINLMGRAGDIDAAVGFFREYQAVRHSFAQHDASYVYNALVDAFLKCEQLESAMQVLEHDMAADKIKVTIIPYNSVIRHHCAHGNVEGARELVRGLLEEQSDESRKDRPQPDASSYGPILAAYCHAGHWQSASSVYAQLLTTDIAKAYGNLANYAFLCLAHGHGDAALGVVNDMRHAGLEPDPALADRIVSFFIDSNRGIDETIRAFDTVLSAMSSRTLAKSAENLVAAGIAAIAKTEHVAQALAVSRALDVLLGVSSVASASEVRQVLVDTWQRTRQDAGAPDDEHDLKALCEAVLESYPVSSSRGQQEAALKALVHDIASTQFRPPTALFNRILGRLRQLQLSAAESEWKAVFSRHRKSCSEADALSADVARAAARGHLGNACRILEHELITRGLVPSADAIRDAVASAGKHGKVDMATRLYDLYCRGCAAAASDDEEGKFLVLNALLIVSAQHGAMVQAKQCYDAIKELGRAPDSNAYASLLLGSAQCATDEATDALTIYEEAKRHNVQPTTFFYNVVISKFGKARKLEPALRLFEEMQQFRIAPNCITYGAVLSACVRAGSETHARRVFGEMLSAPSYQPRVGPFNNMIQFYVRQQPNRTRALEYITEMRRRHIRPSAHTYKLLMEAYATIAPYDMPTAHRMLAGMERRDRIRPQATHYATLIYSYGLLQRDVRSAEQVFESMQSNGHVQPDEAVFQAMLDTLISNGHIGRAEELYHRMLQLIRKGPSPYIENLFIRGYGQQGNLDKAEHFFEAMTDNKLLRSPLSSDNDNPAPALVVREPSTYEAMVQAYLDNGRIDKAKDILDMMAQRDFPPKVLATVADLVLD